MLKLPLLHPQLLGALARAGHDNKVLLADANFPYAILTGLPSELVYLNLAPGLLTVPDVMGPLMECIPVSSGRVMRMDDGRDPEVFQSYSAMLPTSAVLDAAPRQEFYEKCRGYDVALVVATGDMTPYANILLTVGVVTAR